ncbi:MAG: hypothetical protein Q3979_03610 [Actinomycetaceae bacterium]|nr:hypothetical protein [Actinomycetaceae bacterium]
MNKEKHMQLVSRVAAELESARAEFASLDDSVSASRAERAAWRLDAAQRAWDELKDTELAA